MPHQCVHCGTRILDGSKELLTGCAECGSKFFFYIKNKEFDSDFISENLSEGDIKEMENDVRELIGEEDPDTPVILDLETIKTIGPGKFKIDVSALMRGAPIVINVSDGKYFIDLPSAFRERNRKNEFVKHLK